MDLSENLPSGLHDPMFEATALAAMCWLPDPGIGRLPVHGDPTAVYDAAYWDSYRSRADTPIGRALNDARVGLLRDHVRTDSLNVIDVGIGAGAFVQSMNCWGYDVNPAAIEWLQTNGWWNDLYARQYDVATFWDALEHIPVPSLAVAQVKRYAFVSLPVFADLDHCLNSKHYKPGEHLWYFTDRGIKAWFDAQGFDCVDQNHMETDIGREGIGTYVFKRRHG